MCTADRGEKQTNKKQTNKHENVLGTQVDAWGTKTNYFGVKLRLVFCKNAKTTRAIASYCLCMLSEFEENATCMNFSQSI